MKRNLLCVIAIIVCHFSNATIINVPADFSTIQQAINASANGDSIIVQPGTYFENINFRGKKVVLTSLFYLNKDTSYISSTIINGSLPAYPDTASCVIFNSGEDSTTVLQGFTITAGQGTIWLDIHGAGYYREGGGIIIELCSPTIQYNRIINNYAVNTLGGSGAGGGGLRIGDGNPKILNNVIAFNEGKYGPGIVLNYTGVKLKNNLLCYNSGGQSFGGGGAIWTAGSLTGTTKVIENNTIYGNHAAIGTGGILSQGTNLIIRNNIIWANTSPNNFQISLSGGTVNATYNDVQNGYTGVGNINLLPLFFPDTANFFLSVFSPCVDAGDSSSIYNDVEDIANPGLALLPSLGTIRNDMGAYGGQGAAVLGTGILTAIDENVMQMDNFSIYPNPACEFLVIGYQFSAGDQISITDAAGKTIFTKFLSSPTLNLKLQTLNFVPGFYFVELISDKGRLVKKIIIE